MAGSKALKGKDTKLRLMRNGAPIAIIGLKSFSWNQDADFDRDEYLGEVESDGDVDHKGWSGSLEADVHSAVVADAIDALVENNLARVNADDVSLLHTEYYRDGTSASWVYSECQVKASGEHSGQHERASQKLDWQAKSRQKV
jgi:hypothetical protein